MRKALVTGMIVLLALAFAECGRQTRLVGSGDSVTAGDTTPAASAPSDATAPSDIAAPSLVQTMPPKTGTTDKQIQGVVRDANEQPVAGICISDLWLDGGDPNQFRAPLMATKADGTYTLILQFPRDRSGMSHQLEFWDCRNQPSLAPSQVNVEEDATMTYDVVLRPGGSISGIVRDLNGTPLDSACVAVFDGRHDVGGFVDPPLIPIYSTRTDAEGAYRFGGLAPSPHYVLFGDCSPIKEDQLRDVVPQWYGAAYRPTSYESVDPANAGEYPMLHPETQIHVAEGHLTSGIDATLERTGSISGKVLSPNGGSPMRFCVGLQSTNGPQYVGPPEFAVSMTGSSFTVKGLNPGRYKVFFASYACDAYLDPASRAPTPGFVFYEDASSIDQAIWVAVSGGQTTSGIDAQLPFEVPPYAPDPNEP